MGLGFLALPLIYSFYKLTLREQVERERLERLQREKRERRIRVEKFEREQLDKGLVKFIDRWGHEHWGTPEQVEEWKVIDLALNNSFADYSPREFEKFIAELFSRMGYSTQLCPYVADYGGDVIAQKILTMAYLMKPIISSII